MSKKIMKRSLALGALMAFVITGSAMAAELTSGNSVIGAGDYEVNSDVIISGSKETMIGKASYSSLSDAERVNITLAKNKTLTIVTDTDEGGDLHGVVANTNIIGELNGNTRVEIRTDSDSENAVGLGHKSVDSITASYIAVASSGGYAIYSTQSNDSHTLIANEILLSSNGRTVLNGAGETTITASTLTIISDRSAEGKANNAITANGDGKIDINVGNATFNGDVDTLNTGKAIVDIEATDFVTINGNVTVKKGEVDIYADNNVTVTGAVNATGGEGAEDTAYVSIEAKNDVVIKDGVGVLFAKGSEATGRTEGLRIVGNNVTINTTNGHNALYNGAGETKFIAKNELTIGGVNGLVNEGGSINANADKINITATPSGADGGCAVIAMNGETVITPNAGGSANIIGDILVDNYYPNNTPKIDVALGNDGSLKGAVVNEYGNTEDFGVKLDLGTGSTWTVTGESNVTTLSGNSGKLVVSDITPGLVTIGTDSIGSLTVATVTEDSNTDETLSALSKVVTTNDGSVVADKVQLKNAIYDNVTADVNGLGDVTVNEGSKEVAAANVSVNDMAAIGLMSWRAEMNDMNKRMGELRNANGEHGVWVRMVRGESEYNSVKNQYNQYQLGYDEKLSVDKRWTVGVALSYTDAENNFAQGAGESTNKALSIYGSKLNDDGTFIDLIAKYARLENDFTTYSGQGAGEYDANGYSFSAEFGKRIQQGNGLWIEPQVELTYGTVGSADYVTEKGVNVAQDSMDSIVGRIGFSLGKDIKDGNVYARASYLYDFDGETKAVLNGVETLEQDLGGGWWEVGVGANINLSKATYIYADIEKTFGGEVDTNWQWNLGVRYSF